MDIFTFRRPATTHFRDENLKAKLPGGGGRVKMFSVRASAFS
jgi:hypothetical protein